MLALSKKKFVYKCDHCPKTFRIKDEFDSHVEEEECDWKHIQHSCIRCNDFTTQKMSEMSGHLKDCPLESKGQLRFFCNNCASPHVLTITGFKRHQNGCKGIIEDMLISCTRCHAFKTTSHKAMTDHFKTCPVMFPTSLYPIKRDEPKENFAPIRDLGIPSTIYPNLRQNHDYPLLSEYPRGMDWDRNQDEDRLQMYNQRGRRSNGETFGMSFEPSPYGFQNSYNPFQK